MEAAEPLVQRHALVAVVALEVAVVQVVEIAAVAEGLVVLDYELREAGVAGGGAQPGVHEVEYCVDGVRRDHPVHEHAGEVDQVLDRVHGQPRPGADVDVAVVQVVRDLVERLPVRPPVRPVEVHLPDEQDRDHHQRAVGDAGRGPPLDPRQPAVAVHPQGHRLVGGPDAGAGDQRPEHVVPGLVAEQERAVLLRQPAPVVLVLLPLRALDVQPQVQPAGDQDEERDVAQVDLGDPADLEGGGALQGRREKEPRHHRDAHVDQVLRPQDAVVAEDRLENHLQPHRPVPHRGRLREVRRLPLALCVANARIRLSHGFAG